MKKELKKQIDKDIQEYNNFKDINERLRKSQEATDELFKNLGIGVPLSALQQQERGIKHNLMDLGSWIAFFGIILSLIGFFVTGLSLSIWIFENFSMGLGIALFGFNLFFIGSIIYKIGDND